MQENRASLDALARFVGTGAYTGYAPVASGTVGTLPAVLLAPGMWLLAERSPAVYLLSLLAWIAVALWSSERCLSIFGRGDPGEIVIDEIVGFFLAVAFLPLSLSTVVLGFLLFRLFDVVKPPPARQAEALPGAWGVVADDLIAGLMANACLRVLAWLWPAVLS